MYVSLVENAVFRHPKGMDGWRFYRIEYGGCNKECIIEGSIWLPPDVDSIEIETLISGETMEEL